MSYLAHLAKAKRILLVCIWFQVSLLFYYKIHGNILPIGLSYYSFGIIAFLLELYWKRSELKLNLLDYYNTISFFPLLFMGPIQRVSQFSSQLKHKREFKLENMENGFLFCLMGGFKILAIANPLTDIIFHNKPLALNIYGLGLILYCFLSFFKLYAEFSGFIDIATGVSHFLGFKIPINFNRPYLATGPLDLWKRWHISLTLWLRDFIFLPIVLKTKNIPLATIVVIFLVSLWHGFKLEYFYWAIYWTFFNLLAFVFNKKKVQVKKFVSVGLMFFITTLNILCFILPYSGFFNLLKNLMRLDFSSINSLLLNKDAIGTNFYSIVISIFLMIVFEMPIMKRFNSPIKMALLIFFIALFGYARSYTFMYLNT